MESVRALCVVAFVFVIVGCSHPPQAVMDAARADVEAASRNQDIVTYAPDALRNAQDKLAAMQSELDRQTRRSALSRNYDACAALAQEAVALATRAGSAAEEAKKEVASEAAGLVDEVSAAIPEFQRKVWNARGVPGIRLDAINPLGAVPDQARTAVDDARKDIAAGDFAAARARLMAARDQLASSEETITEQIRIARAR